jgi:hypothetical protein
MPCTGGPTAGHRPQWPVVEFVNALEDLLVQISQLDLLPKSSLEPLKSICLDTSAKSFDRRFVSDQRVHETPQRSASPFGIKNDWKQANRKQPFACAKNGYTIPMNIQPDTVPSNNVFTIASKQELTEAFRKIDLKKLVLPEDVQFPMHIRSYYTWAESSGVYVYLVFKLPNWDLPRGVAFKKLPHRGEPTNNLCNWCHAYGSSQEIGLLSMAVSSRVSHSYLICNDLSCARKIEDLSALAGKNPSKYLIELYSRIEKVFESTSEAELD